jgi:nucleotide-binding universal stress UspA family protein
MERFRNILIATDFSDPSELAVRAAPMIEGGDGSKATVVHVVNTPALDPGDVDQSVTQAKELETAIHEHLDRLQNELKGKIGDVKTAVVRSSNAADAICEFATNQNVDLIIMGTTGLTGVARFLIGSVAERVVRHAPCPVLVMREKKS